MDCGGIKHDCKEIKRKVELLVDKELSEQEEKRLLDEIRQCPKCLDVVDIHEKYKKFIIDKLQKRCCHQEIVETIRKQIKKAEA